MLIQFEIPRSVRPTFLSVLSQPASPDTVTDHLALNVTRGSVCVSSCNGIHYDLSKPFVHGDMQYSGDDRGV